MIAVNDYIIIRKDHPERSKNGILLPFEDLSDNTVGAPYTGVVESVGDLVTLVKENDRILFDDLSQPWVVVDKEDLILILKECDVIGILENNEQ